LRASSELLAQCSKLSGTTALLSQKIYRIRVIAHRSSTKTCHFKSVYLRKEEQQKVS
jgi:hypothetical protein